MSVQLIIAPQSTETITTTSTAAGIEFLVDGQNFSSLNTAPQHQSQNISIGFTPPYALIGGAAYPTLQNTWYNSRAGVFAPTTDYPQQISSEAVFKTRGSSIVGMKWGSIYQRMGGLTIGETYRITIGTHPTASGPPSPTSLGTYCKVMISDGYADIPITYVAGSDFGAGATGPFIMTGVDEVWEFTATTTDHTFFMNVVDQNNTQVPINIRFASVQSIGTTSTTTTQGFTADELHDQQILDLYEDETIPLTLSVDDFKDVATKTQSYSKAFHLPATKKNNRIFGNLFEVTKASGLFTFNPYKKTSVMLKENGFIVFEGFLKLIDIVDKKGEISYNVNLYSDSVALMDSMKDLTFADLNLDELDHDYNLTSIEASQTGALPLLNALQADSFAGASGATTTSVLKYPFLNWAGSIRRNATSAQVSDGATANRPSLKRLEDGFRPFINVKYLVDNIFKGAGFTYSSAFFDSSYFSNLFMDFNWGEEPDGAAPLRNDNVKRKSDLTATTVAQFPSFTNVPVNTDNGSSSLALWDNSFYGLQSDVNNLHISGCFDVGINNGDYIQMEVTTFNSDGDIQMSDGTTSFLNINYNNNAVQVPTLLDAARSEMVQWDFLKGLFTMFNLITLQDKQNPSNILIEPYNDVFKDDVTTLDWTHKVDVSDIKLKPIDLKKRVVFKYEEDEEDYPFRVYKTATGGFLYGSLTLDSSQLDLLSGEDEIIASPFAATIMKDLFDDTPELTAPSIYGSNEEVTEFGSIKNLPRILIDTGVYTASDTFYVPAQNGGSDSNKSTYSLFSHTSTVPATSTGDDLNFGACQLIGTSIGVSPLNNLYSTYLGLSY